MTSQDAKGDASEKAAARRSQVSASRVSSTLGFTTSEAARSGDLELVIVEPGRTDVLPLKMSGKLRVGRADSDIHLSDEAVSRQHAVLHVELPDVSIENLTATNPTVVQGSRLEVGQIALLGEGDTALLGGTVLLVRRARPTARGLLWGHAYFLARLTEECERAPARVSNGFCVLRLQLRAGRSAHELNRVLPPGSVLASYGGSHYEALVFGLGRGDSPVTETLKRGLEPFARALGVAVFPDDGTTADALSGVASDRLRGPKAHRAPESGAGSRSARVRALYERARKIAAAPTRRVLITGESGSGKAVLAEFMHRASARASGPFVTLNCAAIPTELVESTLFGHVKGAFSGATTDNPGYLRQAQGGTLFLDEIGELSASAQAKLLTALSSEGAIRFASVGDTRVHEVDVRLIAATNADIARAAKSGAFRPDLYYRLNTFSLSVPPLRECREDVLPLAHAFVDEFALSANKPAPALSAETADLLCAYSWPGNIRELRNVIERGVTLCSGPSIEPEDLELVESESPMVEASDEATELGRRTLDALPPDQARRLIGEALLQTGCHKAKAAEALGVRRQWLLVKMDKLGMPRPRTRT